MFSMRNQVRFGHTCWAFDNDLTLTLNDFTEFNDTVDLRYNRRVLWFSRFNKLCDAWKTARNITGLCNLSLCLGEQRSACNRLAIFNYNVCTRRDGIKSDNLVRITCDEHLRMQVFFMLDNDALK